MYNKTYKFRLYPTRKQTIALLHVISVCRKLYNGTLHDRQVAYEDAHCPVSYYDQQYFLKYKDKHGVHSQVLQDVLRRVDKTFKAFFRRVKNGETPGYPRFKGYGRYDSFTYPDSYGKGYKIENNRVHLSKIGDIRIVQHREIEGTIKTCIIRKDGDQWYACFSAEIDEEVAPVTINTSVGIDVGLTTLATLSDGTKIENPKVINKHQEKFKQIQQNLSRKKLRSENWKKQKGKLANIHRKIRNIRANYLHKISNGLVTDYDQIVFEKLVIKNMIKNHHLAQSIHDAAWNKLIQFVTYKAEWAGKVVDLVDPKYTSQECSICGNIQKMPLQERTYKCSACDNILGRDHNAAINILNKVGQELAKLTPVEMTRRSSLKQEAPSARVG